MAIQRVGKVDTIRVKKRIVQKGLMEIAGFFGRIRHNLSVGDIKTSVLTTVFNARGFCPHFQVIYHNPLLG